MAQYIACGIEPSFSGWIEPSAKYIISPPTHMVASSRSIEAEQRAVPGEEHAEQRLQRPRIARELQQPEHPEDPQHAQIDGEHHPEIARRESQEIHDH